ncbi:uncharacterized protein N7496_011857 [Penicillium cataractarum]|uniref:DUF1479-domain-containing protein n=1 Tax=Penicillium cataractarum TaxID=2100454 RepID=A0A9W9RHM4_9EURO|nr:uncharacterized protein N7496_011857 [Penicillium cataractarum]KAJ5359444.1 hypothetical protein N7496_011857 [Penicillium cataractarum]
MPTPIKDWPAWAEYTHEGPNEAADPEFLAVKKAIIAEYGTSAIRKSWIKVCKELQSVTDEIAEKGNKVIPVFDTTKILTSGFTCAQKNEIKRVGAFVCRATVPEKETKKLYDNLKQFIADNEGSIKGWPKESPSMLILYNSPTQNTLRSHPNHLNLQRKLNELWHDSTGVTTSEPLIYLDGVRDRAPGQPFLGLGPHIDAGSLSRWADPTYRKVYESIFSGNPEKFNPFDLSVRKDANQALYEGMAHSKVLRTFQGWTALTPTAPREGSIMFYPNVKTVIAYMLLRPFFQPPADPGVDIMDGENWTIDGSTGWFPGTFKAESQRLSRSSHPHLRLEECLVYAPPVKAGDTVWWHCDLCHAVDTEQLGTSHASVAFIASCPTTPVNQEYVKMQLACTLEGRVAPDYLEGNDLDETKLKGYVGLDGLGTEARRAFGFHLLKNV